jgi:hypothetical protein
MMPSALPSVLSKMGLDAAIGYLWVMPASTCCLPGSEASSKAGSIYVPYDVSFGAPLYNPSLCRQVRVHLCTKGACRSMPTSLHALRSRLLLERMDKSHCELAVRKLLCSCTPLIVSLVSGLRADMRARQRGRAAIGGGHCPAAAQPADDA